MHDDRPGLMPNRRSRHLGQKMHRNSTVESGAWGSFSHTMSLCTRRCHAPLQLEAKGIDTPAHTPPPASPGLQPAPFLRQRGGKLPDLTFGQVRLGIQSGIDIQQIASSLALQVVTVGSVAKMLKVHDAARHLCRTQRRTCC